MAKKQSKKGLLALCVKEGVFFISHPKSSKSMALSLENFLQFVGITDKKADFLADLELKYKAAEAPKFVNFTLPERYIAKYTRDLSLCVLYSAFECECLLKPFK